MSRLTALVFLLAFAFGCSSGGSSSDRSGGEPPSLTSLENKAGAVHCDNTGGEFFTREGGDCKLNGKTLSVSTFSSTSNRDKWLDTAKGFGGIFVVGDLWVVDVDQQTTAIVVRERLGGEIR